MCYVGAYLHESSTRRIEAASTGLTSYRHGRAPLRSRAQRTAARRRRAHIAHTANRYPLSVHTHARAHSSHAVASTPGRARREAIGRGERQEARLGGGRVWPSFPHAHAAFEGEGAPRARLSPTQKRFFFFFLLFLFESSPTSSDS